MTLSRISTFSSAALIALAACSNTSPTGTGNGGDLPGGSNDYQEACAAALGSGTITGAREQEFSELDCGTIGFYSPGKVMLEINPKLEPLTPYDLPSYFYLYRDEGGLPEPGTYAIVHSASPSYKPTDFAGEFHFRCSTLSPVLCPQGMYELGGGTLVIESVEGSRYRGHFEFKGVANRPLPGYIDVSGAFDISYVKSTYF